MKETFKKKITVLINNSVSSASYISFLSKRFEVETINANEWDTTSKKIDLVLFTGGEDVNPGYYNEKTGSKTYVNSKRDEYEQRLMFARSSLRKVPKLGICRGAQFVTVMSGGSLIQDVSGHALSTLHRISFMDGLNCDIEITSTHHQMMNPYVSYDKNDLEQNRTLQNVHILIRPERYYACLIHKVKNIVIWRLNVNLYIQECLLFQ